MYWLRSDVLIDIQIDKSVVKRADLDGCWIERISQANGVSINQIVSTSRKSAALLFRLTKFDNKITSRVSVFLAAFASESELSIVRISWLNLDALLLQDLGIGSSIQPNFGSVEHDLFNCSIVELSNSAQNCNFHIWGRLLFRLEFAIVGIS